jgi:hypothetical protein
VNIDMIESKKDGTPMLLVQGAIGNPQFAWVTWHAFMN